MFIGCTKKLQAEMGVTLNGGYEEKELFSWSANLIMMRRRKAVVVVNNSNRFGFVLFGLKKKDFKIIDELILQGIRRCLKDEKIKEEIIEQYLSDAGTINFSKTNGSKYVGRLNKACEVVGYFEEILDLKNIYQFEVTKKLNNDYIKIGKDDYDHPSKIILKELKETYDDDIIKCEAAYMLAKLNLGVYKAIRKIITPIDISFKELHQMLQIAFDWKDYHLHEFNVINEKGEQILMVISEHHEDFYQDGGCKVVLESEVFIKEYIKEGSVIVYSYDFGDGWEHEITIESIIPDYDKNYPICIEGAGDAPPEDVGGIPGYEEFLKIMADPKNPEYESMKRWADSQWYRKFDIDLINRRLK